MYRIIKKLHSVKKPPPCKRKNVFLYTYCTQVVIDRAYCTQVSKFSFRRKKNKIVIILSLVHEDFKNTLIMSKLNSAINQSVNNAMWLRTFDEKIQIKSSEAINLHKADNNIKALRRRNFLYYIQQEVPFKYMESISFKKHCLMGQITFCCLFENNRLRKKTQTYYRKSWVNISINSFGKLNILFHCRKYKKICLPHRLDIFSLYSFFKHPIFKSTLYVYHTAPSSRADLFLNDFLYDIFTYISTDNLNIYTFLR